MFLELSCFFHDPADVGNLISGSSAFSKTSLNIRKFTVHILLKPGLENFEHYFTSMWDECNCAVVWAFFGIALPFFEIKMKTDLFQSCGHSWVFQICWRIECSTFTASSFRIWNSSTGISMDSQGNTDHLRMYVSFGLADVSVNTLLLTGEILQKLMPMTLIRLSSIMCYKWKTGV